LKYAESSVSLAIKWLWELPLKASRQWAGSMDLDCILLQILKLKFTTATGDERKTLEMMWNDIFGIIIADADYVSKKLERKAFDLGKFLLAGVRANVKKIMAETEHQLLK